MGSETPIVGGRRDPWCNIEMYYSVDVILSLLGLGTSNTLRSRCHEQ